MNSIIRDIRLKTAYTDGKTEVLDLSCGKARARAFDMQLSENDGVMCPVICAKDNAPINYIEIEYTLSEDFIGGDVMYFENGGCTNDRCFVVRLADKPRANIKSVTVMKSIASGETLGIGQVTAHRFYSWIYIDEGKLGMHYEMEDKPLAFGEKYELEKYMLDTCPTQEFLSRYADTVARLNAARPLKETPVGFCSWSRYYENVTQEKMLLAADGLDKYARPSASLVQIDDGWQIGRPFAGEWEVNTKKFPDMAGLSRDIHSRGMKFGLWVAPLLIGENSPYYSSLEHVIKQDVTLPKTHPFDIGDERFLSHLHDTFARLTRDYDVDYYKLDFLSAGIKSFLPSQVREAVRFDGDYSVALFRRAMQTIRDAVGDRVTLLCCGAPMLECVGIFDAQRVSCDIIWGVGEDFPPMWDIMRQASSTVLHRYFYNEKIYMNDPDGLVFRDYDVGDGFVSTLDEARFWATTVAMSGGLVLHNEELDCISPERRALFTRLLYPIGIAGKPLDFFEDHPRAAVIDYSRSVKYIALYNASDVTADLELELSSLDMDGCMVFDCWEGTFLGVTDKIRITSAPPRSAYMFMVKRVPSSPEFLFSDGDVFLGQRAYTSAYENGELKLTATRKISESIYAFYPAGTVPKGRICFEDEDALGGAIVKI